jgi:hypothetical protein
MLFGDVKLDTIKHIENSLVFSLRPKTSTPLDPSIQFIFAHPTTTTEYDTGAAIFTGLSRMIIINTIPRLVNAYPICTKPREADDRYLTIESLILFTGVSLIPAGGS